MKNIYIVDSCETNNFEDSKLVEKISKVWNNMSSYSGIKYGVYHNYSSNYKGDYTLSVGIEGNIDDAEIIEIPNLEYKIFEVDMSKNIENAIFETWKYIWDLEDKNLLKRDYIIDFEKYHTDGKVEIYIGIEK